MKLFTAALQALHQGKSQGLGLQNLHSLTVLHLEVDSWLLCTPNLPKL